MTAEPLASIIDRGLTEADVLTEQKRSGFNELPSAQSRSLLSLAMDAVRDPIFLLLVSVRVIYWILGDLQKQ
jgi:P-type Ca2+ transporter type 2C